MPRIFLVAAGAHRAPERLLSARTEEDVLIAVNGGHRVLTNCGLIPDRTIGDLDSLDSVERHALTMRDEGVDIHPVDKDATDGQLALDWVRRQTQWSDWSIWIWGGLGDRFDHTLALLLYVATLEDHGRILLTDGVQWAYVLTDRCTVMGKPGDTLSLIPLDRRVTGIHSIGLRFPLQDQTLEQNQTLGVSNALTHDRATVEIRGTGRLALIHHRAMDTTGASPE